MNLNWIRPKKTDRDIPTYNNAMVWSGLMGPFLSSYFIFQGHTMKSVQYCYWQILALAWSRGPNLTLLLIVRKTTILLVKFVKQQQLEVFLQYRETKARKHCTSVLSTQVFLVN